MTMLEKLAEAIEKKVSAAQPIYDWDSKEIARAALQAIREIDQHDGAVLDAGEDAYTDVMGAASPFALSKAFTAMIDAILGETE